VNDSWIIACGAATATISIIGAVLQAALEAKREEESDRADIHRITGSAMSATRMGGFGGFGSGSRSGSVSTQPTERLGYPSDE